MVGGEAVWMAEAYWAFEESDTTQNGEGGLVLPCNCFLQVDDHDPVRLHGGAKERDKPDPHQRKRCNPGVLADGFLPLAAKGTVRHHMQGFLKGVVDFVRQYRHDELG
jgi:hypothetical protein